MTNPRIQRLIDERELEAVPAPADEVADYWRKALRAYADCRIKALSPESAVLLAYQAALSGATAAVRGAGLRVRNRGRHHYVTFYTLAALGEGTALSNVATEADTLRGDRHTAGYEAEIDEQHLRGFSASFRTCSCDCSRRSTAGSSCTGPTSPTFHARRRHPEPRQRTIV